MERSIWIFWRHRGKRAGIFVSGPGENDPARGGRARFTSRILFHNPFQGPLAAKLAKWSGMDRVFFTNSGSEAVEGALKLARIAAKKKPGGATKTRFLALENSFHGRTFGALSITHPLKYREPFEPLVPGVDFVRLNDVADLEAKFDDAVCAVIIEPIQGEGGIYPVSEEFWKRARELATQHGAALIADEIQCGLGRTGRAFAYQRLEGCRTSSSSQSRWPAGCRLARFSRARNSLHFCARPARLHVWRRAADLRDGLEFLNVVEENTSRQCPRARRRVGELA